MMDLNELSPTEGSVQVKSLYPGVLQRVICAEHKQEADRIEVRSLGPL
jgi:hypothetical protein